jgi:type VI secretion system protein ImpA
MIQVDELLKPIAPEAPCGIDSLENPQLPAELIALEGLTAGKPETQFSGPEEPDWKQVRDKCLELFRRWKDLRVAMTLCVASVKLDGAVGLRDGLALIKGLLQQYWNDVFPRMDEDNDPVERVNIVSSLSTPLGTFGDPVRYLERVRQIPLTHSRQLGAFGLADIAGDKIILPNGEEKPPTSPGQIKAAFRDTNADEIEGIGRAISDSITLAKEIDELLTNTVGSNRAPDMGALMVVLTEMQKTVAPYMSTVAGAVEGGEAVGDGYSADQPGVSGPIRSRQDVVRILGQICEYYARTEPSSPLPLLLRRAQRLAEMDFLQIVDELTPSMRAQLEPIVGVRPQGSASTEA